MMLVGILLRYSVQYSLFLLLAVTIRKMLMDMRGMLRWHNILWYGYNAGEEGNVDIPM